jgi:mono/diheme cytochrome c family protein
MEGSGTRGLWLAFAGLWGLFAFLGGAVAEEPDPRAASGEALYHQYCGACHGVLADGRGAVASILTPPPSDLTRIAARRDGVFPEAEVIRKIDGRDPVVAHGTREMPVWGQRFGEGAGPSSTTQTRRRGPEILITRYLASIQKPAAGAEP